MISDMMIVLIALMLSLCTCEPRHAPASNGYPKGAHTLDAAFPRQGQRRLRGQMLRRPNGEMPGGAANQLKNDDGSEPMMMVSLTEVPTAAPFVAPPSEPSPSPSGSPSLLPTISLSTTPSVSPTSEPTTAPVPSPTEVPTPIPTLLPTAQTPEPSPGPTPEPTEMPTGAPTAAPVPVTTSAPAISTQTMWVQFGRDITGAALGDLLGSSVALSSDGQVVAVGARQADANGAFNSGEVSVYVPTPSGLWSRRGSILMQGNANEEFGFSLDLTPDGRILAVGAPSISGFGLRGTVQVYTWVDGFIWVPFGNQLRGEINDEFGISVALSADGRTIAVGAEDSDENGNNSGRVNVYQYENQFWTELGEPIQGQSAEDVFGRSVAISSDGRSALAVGTGPLGGEYVKVFRFVDDAWIQVGQTLEGAADQDRFGFSVSLSSDGSVLAVGAYFNDDFGRNAGTVYTYQLSDMSWVLRGSPIGGEQELDWFGWAVELSGDGNVLIASSLGSSGTAGSKSGRTRVFSFVENSWAQIGGSIDGTAVGDNSGSSVAISEDGSVIAIGALFNSDVAPRAGLVQVFQGV